MADSELVKKLHLGVEAWNEWRQKNPNVGLNLSGADLNRMDLNNVNLSGANLTDASLQNTKLIGANLYGADLSDADLSYAQLIRADLSDAKLSNAVLISARLINAQLRGTNLFSANLANADFTGAYLNGASFVNALFFQVNLQNASLIDADLGNASLVNIDLSEAKLSGADFSGAELGHVIFNNTHLCEANFDQTTLADSVFANTDLSATKGLRQVKHERPSTIGTDTLYRSRGDIPNEFLRGAGVSEEIIMHLLPSIRGGDPIQFYSCFISYSHADKAFARRLHDTLQGRGIRCWLDEHQLLPGDQIHRSVDEAVRLWDKVLLCCSEASLQSWWVDKEIQKALMKEEQLWKERGTETLAIIPLNLDGHLFSPGWKAKQDWKAQHLTTRLAADFTGWENDNPKFDTQFDLLIKALRADSHAREKPPKPLL